MPGEKEAIRQELLVLRGRRGDRAAQEEIIRLFERRLFYYIRRLVDTEEDAWDVLGETWYKALNGLRNLREARSLPVWLYRIARDTAMSHLRARYARRRLVDDDAEVPDVAEEADEPGFEDAECVHKALSRLSLAHREALTLHFLEDMPVEGIAEVLGLPAGTVKSRLHYARRALRAALEEGDGRNGPAR